jgi:hypothetical protein
LVSRLASEQTPFAHKAGDGQAVLAAAGIQYRAAGFAGWLGGCATLPGMQPPANICDFYPQWMVHGAWPCGHAARIDLGRFMAWGMHDVPMVALCRRLRCPTCGGKGPAEIGTGWVGKDSNELARSPNVRPLKPRAPK